MWTTIVTSLLPFAVKLISYFIDKNHKSKERDKKWLEFLKQIQNEENVSVRLRKETQKQIIKLEDSYENRRKK